MKKYKSISLIETLISLAIVGLSITALLPVMTVKKEATDSAKGNTFWSCEDSSGNTVDCTDGNTRIVKQKGLMPVGIGNAPTNETPRLFVDSTGFKNQGIIPLFVQNQLQYAGQTVTTQSVNGESNVLWFGNTGRNLYLSDKKVIIDNAGIMSVGGGVMTLHTQHAGHGNGGRNLNYTKTITDKNIYSISNTANTEYIHVNATDNIVGIGENATRMLPDNKRNIVVIATNSGLDSGQNIQDSSLLIGNVNTAATSINVNTGYVISKNGGAAPLNIHSHVSVGNGTGTINSNAFIISSDKRLKDVLGKYTKGTDEILQLRPVNFAYKNDESQTPHVGVIAQDLKKVFPESVSTNKENGYLMVNTDGIFYALLNSIKSLNTKNKELEKQNKELENKIAQLREIRDRIRAEKGGQHE